MENINDIIELVTKENITLALSIFGAVGTLITFVSGYIQNWKNLRIIISNATYNQNLYMLLLSVTFENRSRLPIAVTTLSLFSKQNEILPFKYPKCVEQYAHRQGSEVVDRKFLYNLNFPVDIQQLSAASGYVLFEISPEDFERFSTHLTLQVRSTRGSAQKIQLDPNLIKCC